LPQALSKFRLLKALAEVVALGLGLAREPAPVALVARVLGAVVLLVRLELVVRLGLVVPVPVLAVQALLLRVVLAPAAPAAIRLAIQARGRTASARRRRPARLGQAMWNRASKAAPGHARVCRYLSRVRGCCAVRRAYSV